MQKEKGFTIIELAISIFILSFAIVGIFGAFSLMIVATNNASARLTAAYLAQEGTEIVRNIRDNNWLDENSAGQTTAYWKTGLTNCSNYLGCEADYESTTLPAYNNNYLYIDSDGFYSYKSGSLGAKQSKFTRQIKIECLNPDGSVDTGCASTDYVLRVTVNVYWDEKATLVNPNGCKANDFTKNAACSFTTQEYLYNWYYIPSGT